MLPSVGRIASFALLVLALLLFYEQVKMFLYRHDFLRTWPHSMQAFPAALLSNL